MAEPSTITSIAWHAVPAEVAAWRLDVDPADGLSSREAARRLERYGANRLTEAKREPRWQAFLRQFQDLLILILLVAAVLSLVVSREWETPAAIAAVVLLNASIGFIQESRAEASLEALKQMLVITATVRRDGKTVRLDAGELVPGDVIMVEAGDRVPADGRLLSSISLDVQESSLTGEAQPVGKAADAQTAEQAPLGDRTTVVFMNTMVTRGRGVAVVTATGMATETGRLAGMLHEAKPPSTPLQRQIDALGRTLAIVAGVVVVVVFALGLLRGQDFGDLFGTAISLAVAAIPEGLPAVVAFTLAMGAGRLAERGAIIKRLASVETLGSTSQICTDKTGTLTLNQMTARAMVLAGRRFTVTGEGYSTAGRIRTTDGSPLPGRLDDALLAMALCNDAVQGDGEVVGDPTEAAMVVLAEKGGIDVAALRQDRPRLAEVPFDSDYKFMATFHRWTDERGRVVVRCFLKGAPDVLAARADRYLGGTEILPFDDAIRRRYDNANVELAEQGMRVMAVGAQDFAGEVFDSTEDLKDLVDRVVLLALVGIVDPPRPEARQAIAQCRDAGVQVRMVTGDHPVTAAAIAGQLDIPGHAVSGADLDQIGDDTELARRLDEIGVVARVTPAHKIRIIQALQIRGDVVAMTGDGVNDAPALKTADIGVAMGITGTDVSKQAADMILADDNFATIVAAVEEGRSIFSNIRKFLRFLLSSNMGEVMTMFFGVLLANVIGLQAEGSAVVLPLLATQLLWINLATDGAPALALGVDPPDHAVMGKPPRPAGEPVITRRMWTGIFFVAVIMAAGTLIVLDASLPGGFIPGSGNMRYAQTMAFTTLMMYQLFNVLNARSDERSAFTHLFSNAWLWCAIGLAILLQIAVVYVPVLQQAFSTVALSLADWLRCTAVASSVLWLREISKVLTRRSNQTGVAQP